MYREGQAVRLLHPYASADVYQGGEVRHFRAGQVGVIVDVLSGGDAFEVDFETAEDECIVTLEASQVEPAS